MSERKHPITALTVCLANNITDETLVGWVDDNYYRGTMDILWSCCITICLCVWVSTHPNVPGPNDRWQHRLLDKVNMAFIGLVGPDFLFAISCGQLSSARRSIQRFKDLPESVRENREWTLTHGFFVDMGGFILTSPDFPQGFPVNGQEFFYLVEHGHIDLPDLTLRDIKDMNSVDSLSKTIVVWQVLWFIITEISRMAYGYPITTLELTALSFALMMMATSANWFYKPTINKAVVLKTKYDRTVEQIRDIAQRTTHPDLPKTWYKTPLRFISRKFHVQTHWRYNLNVAHWILRYPIFSRPVETTPWDRIPSDTWLPISGWGSLLFCCLFQVPFSFSFVLAWFFHYPTTIEMWVWRVSSIYHLAFSLGGGLYYLIGSLDGKTEPVIAVELRELKHKATLMKSHDDEESRPGTTASATRADSGISQPDRSKPPALRLAATTFSHSSTFHTALAYELRTASTMRTTNSLGSDEDEIGLLPPSSSGAPNNNRASRKSIFSHSHHNIHHQYRPRLSRRSQRPSLRARVVAFLERLRNLSPDQDPDETVPLRSELILVGIAITYVICRMSFFAQDFIGLRDQPMAVYKDVNKYLPFM